MAGLAEVIAPCLSWVIASALPQRWVHVSLSAILSASLTCFIKRVRNAQGRRASRVYFGTVGVLKRTHAAPIWRAIQDDEAGPASRVHRVTFWSVVQTNSLAVCSLQKRFLNYKHLIQLYIVTHLIECTVAAMRKGKPSALFFALGL